MRFRVSAKVEAHGVSREPFQLLVGDLRVGITVGDKSAVTGIWVDLPVADYEKWMPSLTPGDGTASNPHQIAFNEPPAAERLMSILQYLESLGSFWLGIHRIDWQGAKREWIAESEAEKGRIPVSSVSSRLAYERRPIPFNLGIVQQLLEAEDAKRWLVIPMSFLREGQNDYAAHRYVNAFYNFYFFLEDLFGHGKTKNRRVLEMFRSSEELKAATVKAYQHSSADRHKRESLERLMAKVGGDTTADGLLEFLVMMRGELHHFSRKSSRPKGHPFNQYEFQPLAFFVLAICLNVVPHLITGVEPTAFAS